jgi:hypothetical protein
MTGFVPFGEEEKMLKNRSGAAVAAVLLFPALLAFAGCSDTTAPTEAISREVDDRGDIVEVVIDVSPATLVLDSPGTWVTVHAEIALSEVDGTTVTLDGVTPDVVKADNRGELVAKFDRASIVAIVSPPEATLTLNGLTVSGVPFAGTDTITVQ